MPHTTVRVSQFHPLVGALLRAAHRTPVLPVPAGWRLEPVDVGDVAAHLVARVGPSRPGRSSSAVRGRWTRRTSARSWLAARGARGRVLPVVVPAGVSRAFRAGADLVAADAPRGTTTWETWLSRTAGESSYPV